MRSARRAILLLLAAVLVPAAVLAATTYVTDQVEITLRSGPGLDFKILRMVRTGTPLERLEDSEGWTHVRTPEGDDGWVVTRYLSDDPPKGPLLEAARQEVDRLKGEVARLQKELKEAAREGDQSAARVRKLSRELKKVNKEYDAWKKTNAGVIDLKEKAERLTAAHETALAELERLRSENRALTARERFYWFFSGAVVLLLGWLLGYLYASSRSRAKGRARFKL